MVSRETLSNVFLRLLGERSPSEEVQPSTIFEHIYLEEYVKLYGERERYIRAK
jgi:hypothetical protein